MLVSFLTHADGFHSVSLLRYLVDVLVGIIVVVIVGVGVDVGVIVVVGIGVGLIIVAVGRHVRLLISFLQTPMDSKAAHSFDTLLMCSLSASLSSSDDSLDREIQTT